MSMQTEDCSAISLRVVARPYLANTDSVAVYHTDGKNGNKLPADFCLNTTGSYVVSVMRDRTDGQEYLVVVNKSFRKEMTADFTVVGNSLDLSAVMDITSGTPTALKKNGNGFSLSLKAGGQLLSQLLPKVRSGRWRQVRGHKGHNPA